MIHDISKRYYVKNVRTAAEQYLKMCPQCCTHSKATTPMPPLAMEDLKFMTRIEIDLVILPTEKKQSNETKQFIVLNAIETTTYGPFPNEFRR